MTRTIMHIDMNSYFASVEQAANPALKGKPVVVIGAQQRTVILTASYEARKFGVKTGMMLFEARQLCPRLILVPADNRKYTGTSARITQILLDYSPTLVETFSIDEAFLDLTGSLELFGSAEQVAYGVAGKTVHAMDTVNNRYGDFTVTFGSLLAARDKVSHVISPAWQPSGIRSVAVT
jgi:DNA polymerase-4